MAGIDANKVPKAVELLDEVAAAVREAPRKYARDNLQAMYPAGPYDMLRRDFVAAPDFVQPAKR